MPPPEWEEPVERDGGGEKLREGAELWLGAGGGLERGAGV